MKKIIYSVLFVLICSVAIGCKSKIQYIPIETIRKEIIRDTIRDTVIQVKLVPYYSENKTKDSTSFLENKYAFSYAFWDGRLLNHTLGIKDIDIPVEVQYRYREVIKIDSIPYPVEVQVKGDVIYQMKWYEEVLYYIGLLALVVGGGFGLLTIIKRKLFG